MSYVLFMCKCVLPPGVNPTAADKYISINMSALNMCECESYTLIVCGEDLKPYLSIFSNTVDGEEEKDLVFLYLNLSQNLRT
jgi:hypothetical protein